MDLCKFYQLLWTFCIVTCIYGTLYTFTRSCSLHQCIIYLSPISLPSKPEINNQKSFPRRRHPLRQLSSSHLDLDDEGAVVGEGALAVQRPLDVEHARVPVQLEQALVAVQDGVGDAVVDAAVAVHSAHCRGEVGEELNNNHNEGDYSEQWSTEKM